MRRGHRLGEAEREVVKEHLRRHLAGRAEIRFAVLHGSFLEDGTFGDIDIAVSLVPGHLPAHDRMRYEIDLEGEFLERLGYPVDVRVIDGAPMSFRFAATRGEAVVVRDADGWADFREHTWRVYLDFAPVREEALRDLVR